MVDLSTARQNIVSEIIDGTPNTITPSKLRQLLTDTIDAIDAVLLPFSVFDADAAPTADDDGANTSGNGVFAVGSKWYDQNAGEAYECLNNATGAAVWAATTIDVSDLGTAAAYNVGTSPNNVVQLNGSGELPVVSGANLTNLSGEDAASIKTKYESNGDTNAFTDAEKTKLAGMEASADVTDTENVVAALDGASIPAATPVSGDQVLVQDADDSGNLKLVPAGDLAALGGGDGGGASSGDVKLIQLRLEELEGGNAVYDDGFSDIFQDTDGVDEAASSGHAFTTGSYAKQGEIVVMPTMTAGTTDGFTVTSSPINNDNPAWKAFDGSTAVAAKWYVSSVPAILIIALPSAQAVNKYFIQAPDESAQTARIPRDWTFEGSHDNSNWDVLDTQVNVTPWANEELKEFTFANGTAYSFYRINVTSPQSGSGVSIGECQLYVVADGFDLISNAVTASSAPDEAALYFLCDITGSPTLNTDIIASASREDGSAWAVGTLVNAGTYADGKVMLKAEGIDLSGQTSGTDMRYRFQTANGADVKLLATRMRWA